jgi:hypothetical protein
MVFAATAATAGIVLLVKQASGMANFAAWKDHLRGTSALQLLNAAVPELQAYAMRMLALETRPAGRGDTSEKVAARKAAINTNPAYQPLADDEETGLDFLARGAVNKSRAEAKQAALNKYEAQQQELADKQDAAFLLAGPAIFDWLELHLSTSVKAEIAANARYKAAREEGEYGRDGYALYQLLKDMYGAAPAFDTPDKAAKHRSFRDVPLR